MLTPDPATPRPRQTRRDDIQGLRAIGALLVAAFHIWVGRVSGGVDVFFVVSGFLLVGSMVRELRNDGRVDFVAFIGRLVKRLLPASLFVIAVVLVSAPFWMPQTRWAGHVTHVLASTLYVENWYLAWSAVDYLARDEVASPLQHYWAMSAQVQALVLLCLTMTVTGLVIRKRTGHREPAAIAVLIAVFALSFAYSVYATATNQPVAYFNTFARIWEFALGGLTAVLLSRVRLPAAAQLIGGWLGLFLVLSCGVLLQVSTIFPGYAALWPTLGAALILLCGQAKHRFSVRRLLSLQPLNWLGGISYALYLWHWPLLIAFLTVTYQTQASFAAGSAILAASVVLAWLTTRLVEGPFRTVREDRPWRTIAVGVAAVALIAAGDGAWRMQTARAVPADKLTRPDPLRYPGAAVFDRGYFAADGKVPVKPGPLWMKRDVSPLYAKKCHQDIDKAGLVSCTFGDPNAARVLALVGGSHSAHYFSAIEPIVTGQGWRVVTFTKSGCVFATPRTGTSKNDRSCARWNENLMARLIALRPDIVFTTATHGRDGANEHVVPQFAERWAKLTPLGVHVVAIRDNPWFPNDVPECVQVNGPDSVRCTMPRSRALAATSPLANATTEPRLHFVDITDHLCPETRCPVVAGNIVMYSDRHHLTNTFVRTLIPYLSRSLVPIMTEVDRERSVPR
ncbi:acyltransferase family protein [Sphingomonas yantingensis]|uniref:Peptidoglycan/LPS O-acetylase OafA/YrhL n=1 Tax=Sphingomonas yantingensis TaxID=1241761 RepID=A0A7W9EIK6_9SPHN|nr:acyltransferase family protein [Sphingomonas yantingensis]MBB5699297.1 peptidoglycan/LPS O-acetylase OafA/YrhL [Sphingomonas yantingensis]